MRKLGMIFMALIMALGLFSGCGKADTSIHVSESGSDENGNGSAARPYATIDRGIKDIQAGITLVVHGGTYAPFELRSACSGTPQAPVTVCAAEGETPIIDAGDGVGILMNNVSNITLSGFEVKNGKYGIYYSSTADQGDEALENITIKDCTVRDVDGYHGICVYATNDKAPVKNITMEGCHVYSCRCDSSESTVFNGNIDGFIIRNNVIHDNNNIGIDMIGFEGNAMHGDGYDGNPFDVDYVRNGKCYGNTVYNISAYGNKAYWYDGGYDLCADGIYVDGGQNIEIYDNFVYNCDIGIEVATEHSPDDNELFRVSGVEVHDNIIAGCTGWCGLAFGGYAGDLGFTENCSFNNNTFIDNSTHIGVQRSCGNRIFNNIFVGGETGIEFNTDCAQEDLVNEFGDNIWCTDGDFNALYEGGDFDMTVLFGVLTEGRQQLVEARAEVLSGFASLKDGFGSAFVPSKEAVDAYNNN